MKKLLLALALLFAPSVAWAQCNGSFGANMLCGTGAAIGPPGPVSLTNSSFVFSGVVSQAATNLFYVQNGAKVDRLNDRLLIAGATLNNAAFPSNNADWLSAYMNGIGGFNILTSTQAAVLNDNSNASANAWTAAIQTSNFTATATAGIANAAFAINNNTTLATNAWAFYSECHKANNVVGSCYGIELEALNHANASAPADPFAQGGIVSAQVGCGAGVTNPTSCSAAVQIVSAGAPFGTGINIISTAIAPGFGAGGTTPAIALPTSNHIVWFSAANTFAGSITTNPSKFIIQKASGQEWQSATGSNLFDCNITAANACNFNVAPTFAAGASLTGGQSLVAFSGGGIIWENAANNNAFTGFNNGGTWVLEFGSTAVMSVNSSGGLTLGAGITLNGGNNVNFNSGGGGIFSSPNNAHAWSLADNSNDNLQFQHDFSTIVGVFTPTGDVSGFTSVTFGGDTGITRDSAGVIDFGNSTQQSSNATLQMSSFTLQGTPVFTQNSTGAGTQTFTNSPCSALTTEKWLKVKIVGSTSQFFVPACS